jgi:hypothetical protein
MLSGGLASLAEFALRRLGRPDSCQTLELANGRDDSCPSISVCFLPFSVHRTVDRLARSSRPTWMSTRLCAPEPYTRSPYHRGRVRPKGLAVEGTESGPKARLKAAAGYRNGEERDLVLHAKAYRLTPWRATESSPALYPRFGSEGLFELSSPPRATGSTRRSHRHSRVSRTASLPNGTVFGLHARFRWRRNAGRTRDRRGRTRGGAGQALD